MPGEVAPFWQPGWGFAHHSYYFWIGLFIELILFAGVYFWPHENARVLKAKWLREKNLYSKLNDYLEGDQDLKTQVTLALGILYASLGLLIILFLHIYVPLQSPLDTMVSAYATDKIYGFRMQLAFVAIGLAALCIIIAMSNYEKESKSIGKNLQYHADWEGGLKFQVCVIGLAAISTIGMVFFTMRVIYTIPNYSLMVTTEWEGRGHSLCCIASFALTAISMLAYTIAPPRTDQQWLRGTALAMFNVVLVGVMVFVVLPLGSAKGTLIVPGSGISERILILLFIQWLLALLFVTRKRNVETKKLRSNLMQTPLMNQASVTLPEETPAEPQ